MKTSCLNCDRPGIAKGLCASHYYSARRKERNAEIHARVRVCANCKQDFSGRDGRAIYCSIKCKDAAQNAARRVRLLAKRADRTCRQCGKAIDRAKPSHAIYCSMECDWKFQGKTHADRKKARNRAQMAPCRRCGKTIENARSASAKYCSPECRRVDLAARWRAKSPGYMRQYLYGITPEQYATRLEAQGGRCAICRTDTPGGKGNWHVDHDHATNEIRGLLCHNCNLALGNFRDDPTRLQAAIDYLTH